MSVHNGIVETRDYRTSKTRQGRPKVTLYKNGHPIMSEPVETVAVAHVIGKAWARS